MAWQLIWTILILKTARGLALFTFLGDLVTQFLIFLYSGAKFLYGEKLMERFIGFAVLPTLIVFSSFITINDF
ncbi:MULTISPECIES: Na+ dependent nucleoside transporter N-terminal domain-containing protein [unclassified Microcoleus]|uniref:Na+ dependent nucleoside transporter N-terminal domain-containing protein n=1 Tax=unclassified Microcoleus TaxID=2642155 RepID=UPI002FD2D3B8